MANGTLFGLTDPNVWKVAVRMTVQNQKIQTGFKLRDLAVQDNTAQSVIDAVDPWVVNFLVTLLLTVDTIDALDVTRLGGEEGAEKIYVNQAGTLGHSLDHSLPTWTAVNVALKTSLRKRYGQGRMFLPLRSDIWQDADFLSPTGIGAFNNVITGLTDAFSGSVLTHDLVLVNTHGILPAKAATATSPGRQQIPAKWYDVEAVKLNTLVSGVRSRKIGIGA